MARGRPRDVDAQERILDAAVDEIVRCGAGRVRVDDIAAAAGVGKQTIYRWWPSKHALVIDAIVRRSILDTPFRDSGDARADLRHHLRAVVRIFTSPTGALVRELVAEAQVDPAIADELRVRFWAPRRALSTAFLRRAIERGQVRADLDLEVALDAVYGPLWTRLLIGHGPLDRRFVDDLLAVVWPGLVVGEAPR